VSVVLTGAGVLVGVKLTEGLSARIDKLYELLSAQRS